MPELPGRLARSPGMEPKVLSQEVVWIPECRWIERAEPVLTALNARIWTLYTHMDPDAPPQLPIVPRHMFNAFLEDYIHDWNHTSGRLRYYSRGVESRVWILIEHLERAPRRKPARRKP